MDNLNWDEIGQAVVDFLSGLNWGELLREWGDVVGKALGGAMKGIDLGDALWLGNSIIDGIWRGMLSFRFGCTELRNPFTSATAELIPFAKTLANPPTISGQLRSNQ